MLPTTCKGWVGEVVPIPTFPSTCNPVPLINFRSVEVCLETITLLPSFFTAVSIKPSSVALVTSEVLPVILAYTIS